MTPCPNCGKPVDPIRSRHVSVREGKVVAYCSPECLEAATTRPVRATDVPRPLAALDSEPVIEITHEPAPGVVTSAPDKREQKRTEKQEKLEKKAAEKAAKRATESRAAEPRPAEKATEKPAEKAAEKPAEKAAEKPADKPADKPAEKPAEKPVAAKPRAATDPSSKKAGHVSVAALAGGAGKPKRRSRRDSLDAKNPLEWLDDEPAELVTAGGDHGEEDARPAKSGPLGTILVALVLLGIAGAAAYFLYFQREGASPTETPKDRALVTDVVVLDAAAPVDPAAVQARAKERALGTLREALKNESNQVKELAAIALSRAGDPEALKWLADAMPRAGTNTKKLELAYALARGGDTRGTDQLVAVLGVESRDTRVDACKKLTDLGDARALPALRNVLKVGSRIEIATLLARLGDAQGKKILEEIRANKPSSDEHIRATIGLARAGVADVVPELVQLLGDVAQKLYRHDTSLALAELKVPAARPVLVENLQFVATQKAVARALRRLDPGANLSTEIAMVEPALDSAKDLERIHAAEVLLLLAGPPEWTALP